jgi:hypothetical protein
MVAAKYLGIPLVVLVRFYYDRRTCDQWRDLSNTYLHGFRTRAALLRMFDRRLHRPC